MTRAWTALGFVSAVCCEAFAGQLKCPPDSAKVGNVCIDLYEATIWQIPVANTSLIKKVQAGKARLVDLTSGGAVELTFATNDPPCSPALPANFPVSGQWVPAPGSRPPSPGVYAVSIAGVPPSTCVSWFQAAQACRASGKRLLTNLEWQDAVAGTPDPGTDNGTSDCNVSQNASGTPVPTGSRSACKSSWGVFDMVGNAEEWVADWGELPGDSGCGDWTASSFAGIPGHDYYCFGGPGTATLPGPYVRGGMWNMKEIAGPFALDTTFDPSTQLYYVGFRCAR